MKKCPNCGELIGDNVDECFNCSFNIRAIEDERIKKEREIQEKVAAQKRIEEENRIKAIKEQTEKIFSLNDLFEYEVVTIQDLQTGESNTTSISSTINNHACQGWRLHTIYTNEIGKNSHQQAFGISTINATIDQTVLVFERRIAIAK